MFEDIKKYSFHYILLLIILVFGFGIFLTAGSDKTLQTGVGILTVVCYFLWGMIHHYLKDDLHFKIVVEYLLIATLSLVIVLSLMYRL